MVACGQHHGMNKIACGKLCQGERQGAMQIVELAIMTETGKDHAGPSPAQAEDAASAIARLHDEHHRQAGPLRRWVERMTHSFAQPMFTPLLTLAVLGWIALNVGLEAAAPDPPPFAYLGLLVALAALYLTGMILATQQRASELATHREQMTLQLSILAEQKTAKLIQLLEKLRSDHPEIADSDDEEARIMSAPADLHDMMVSIKQIRQAGDALEP